jgi:transposase
MSKRKYFTPEQKVAIVRRHLLEGVPVSDLCDELGIHATQYYNWQKQLFENAAPAFERRPNKANQRRQEAAAERKIAELQAKLQKKNEVVAELLEEHVQLKKELGER